MPQPTKSKKVASREREARRPRPGVSEDAFDRLFMSVRSYLGVSECNSTCEQDESQELSAARTEESSSEEGFRQS